MKRSQLISMQVHAVTLQESCSKTSADADIHKGEGGKVKPTVDKGRIRGRSPK